MIPIVDASYYDSLCISHPYGVKDFEKMGKQQSFQLVSVLDLTKFV